MRTFTLPGADALRTMTFAGNTVQDLLIAILLFLCVLLVLRLYSRVALQSLQFLAARTPTTMDDAMLDVVRRMGTGTYAVIALFVAAQYVRLPPLGRRVIGAAFGIIVVYWAILVAQRLALRVVERVWIKRGETIDQMPQTFPVLIKAGLWSLGVLLILSNIGVNVTSLIAGLGIGGVAIALAVQNILGDLFSSFSIYFDKPFRVGDFIITGGHSGTVKSVGWKTTRLQAVQGEEIIISNQELTSGRVQNFKRMKQRRVEFNFGIDYATPVGLLRQIPSIVTEILASIQKAKLERVCLKELGESGLVHQVVYQVLTEEYATYMNIQQEINLHLLEEFAKRKICFAFPVRRVHVVT